MQVTLRSSIIVMAMTLVLLAGSGCRPHSPAATPTTAGIDTFPQQPGLKLVYRITSTNSNVVSTETTTLVDAKGDLLTYDVLLTAGTVQRRQKFWAVIHDNAIYDTLQMPVLQKPHGTHSISGATRVLQFPLVAGVRWTSVDPGGTAFVRTVEAQEKVTVPAGTFDAVRILDERNSATGYAWYVPDIGIVKAIISGAHPYIKELLEVQRPAR